MDGAVNRGKCIVEGCTMSSHLNVAKPPDHEFVRREQCLNCNDLGVYEDYLGERGFVTIVCECRSWI